MYDFLHEFWWHDFNILHMALCTPGQVLGDSSLLGHKNMSFINFYRAPNELMLIWDSNILNLIRFTTLIQDWISIQFSIQHADHRLHILCQLTQYRSINPTQFFWSLNPFSIVGWPRTGETLNKSLVTLLFLVLFSCHIYFQPWNLMLCSHSSWPCIHCCNYCIFWLILKFIACLKVTLHKRLVKSNAKSI